MLYERTSYQSKMLVAVGMIVYLILAARSLTNSDQLDLFVYRYGSETALEGQSPYDVALLRAKAVQAFPPKHADDFALNCGYFLPPQAIAMFVPAAKSSWSGAEVGWFCVLTLMAVCCGTLAWTFGRTPSRQGTGWAVLVLTVLLNPVTMPMLVIGQTGLFFVGCIALGQYCFENRGPRMGCFLWALTFVKPQLAIPFFVLAWILGGWKRAAGIAVVVGGLNLLGGLIVTGSLDGAILLFLDYIDYVGSAHKLVKYNLVEFNYQILSWNRFVAALGGPAIDLKARMILAGFAVWGGLILVRLRLGAPWRVALSSARLDSAFLLAIAVAAALFFAQVLAYELILIVLLAPLILQHIDRGQRWDAYALIGIVLFLLMPMSTTDRIADLFRFDEGARERTLLRSHRCFGMAALALYLLIRGPAEVAVEITPPRPAADSSDILE